MSTEYNNSREVPTDILCKRLRELSDAVTKGSVGQSEFTMRVPAECDRDADLVLYEAANRLEQLTTLQAEKESLLQQAQIWKQEARTQQSIVYEIYQHITGKTGEPGDWNGAKPVIAHIERLEGELGRLQSLAYNEIQEIRSFRTATEDRFDSRVDIALKRIEHPTQEPTNEAM